MPEINGKENNATIRPSAKTKSRHSTGWRKWLFRLLAMTVVPAILLVLVEMLLRLCSYGHPPSFFLAGAADGPDAFIENKDFGLRFFPTTQARFPMPLILPRAKAAGTYRIFILGESAAAGVPDFSYHFGRILQAMLQARYPETQFEVINTGVPGITSHVILPIARECAEHEPDLFIVYMGNNEVIGPYGTRGNFDFFSTSLRLIRAHIWVKATRTGQLVARVMQLVAGSEPRPLRPGDKAIESPVAADDPRLATIYAHFAANLQDICGVGRDAGAKVLVCTVAANLKDCAPFASQPAAGLSADQVAAWQKIVAAGIARESAREPAAAAACYRSALETDDRYAELHFRLARCLTALQQPAEARRHYVLARDLDAFRIRTDSHMNERIRTTVSGRQDEGIYLADVEKSFADACADGTPGEELFYEHVHLTFAGNYRLAHTVLEQIDRILPDSVRGRETPAAPFLSEQECQERLPFTEWNRRHGLSSIAAVVFHQHPFTWQLDRAERQARWSRRLAELQKRLAAGGGQEAVAAYRRVLKRHEGDFFLHKDFAKLLTEQGLLDEAAQQSREALQQVRHDGLVHTQLAGILALQGKLDQALASCEESLKLTPDSPDALNMMGQILFLRGGSDKAVVPFTQALKFSPFNTEYHTNLGKAWEEQQQHERAAAAYNEAVRIDGHYLPAHLQLGRLLQKMGRIDAAQHHLQEALRIDPQQAQTHADLAAVLLARGNAEEAISHLEAALRLRPKWPEVAKALQDVLRQKNKTR